MKLPEQPRSDKDKKAASSDDKNVRVEDDPCKTGPYKNMNCPPGSQAHHIMPDYTMRYGTRADAGMRIGNMPSLDEGMAICAKGGAKEAGSEHNQLHSSVDLAVAALGDEYGLAKLGDVVKVVKEKTKKVKDKCKEAIDKAIDKQFRRQGYGHAGAHDPTAPDAEGTAELGAGRPAVSEPMDTEVEFTSALPIRGDRLYLAASPASMPAHSEFTRLYHHDARGAARGPSTTSPGGRSRWRSTASARTPPGPCARCRRRESWRSSRRESRGGADPGRRAARPHVEGIRLRRLGAFDREPPVCLRRRRPDLQAARAGSMGSTWTTGCSRRGTWRIDCSSAPSMVRPRTISTWGRSPRLCRARRPSLPLGRRAMAVARPPSGRRAQRHSRRGEERVWVAGLEGALLVGNHRSGFTDLTSKGTAHLFHDLTVYRGTLFLGSNHGLFRYDELGRRVVRVRTNLSPELACVHTVDHADGVLWCVGPKDIACFDGDTWTRIHHPRQPDEALTPPVLRSCSSRYPGPLGDVAARGLAQIRTVAVADPPCPDPEIRYAPNPPIAL